MRMEDVAEGLDERKDTDDRMAVILKETGELTGSAGCRDDAYKEDAEGKPVMIGPRVYKLTV